MSHPPPRTPPTKYPMSTYPTPLPPQPQPPHSTGGLYVPNIHATMPAMASSPKTPGMTMSGAAYGPRTTTGSSIVIPPTTAPPHAATQPHGSIPFQGTYQLTQAQLSPPASTTMMMMPAMTGAAAAAVVVGDGFPTHPIMPASGTNVSATATASKSFATKLQGLFQRSNTDGPKVNLGFTPTAKLASLHEKHRQQYETEAGEGGATHAPSATGTTSTSTHSGGGTTSTGSGTSAKALYRFQVTKLRSWRTGYLRLLVLYPTEFATLDPHSDDLTETNRWPYSALTEWQAKEGDTILLQVANDVLKFSCHHVHRAYVLTALLQCQDVSGSLQSSSTGSTKPPVSGVVTWTPVERYLRRPIASSTTGNFTRLVQLQVKSYGVLELDLTTMRVLQTYRYVDMVGITVTPDHERGVIIHFHQPFKSRLYLVPNRTDFCRLIHERYAELGLQWPTTTPTTAMNTNACPAWSIPEWIAARRCLDIGTIITLWSVRKETHRQEVGFVARQLAITGKNYLAEKDGAGIVSCRRLVDIASLIRLSGDELLIEYRDGTMRKYACTHRDALMVAIMDSCSTVVTVPSDFTSTEQSPKRHVVHIADVPSARYSLASFGRSVLLAPSSTPTSGTSALFQPIAIPVYLLHRVYAFATQVYSYISHQFDLLSSTPTTMDLLLECETLTETCREFNASVLPTGEGLPGTDKTILGCIGALWGLLSGLVQLPTSQRRDDIISTLLQTLYRLSRTELGYKGSAELTTLQEAIPLVFRPRQFKNAFCQFWAFQLLDVLLAGFPDRRDLETEYVNKNVILKCGGLPLIQSIVQSLIFESMTEQSKFVSDLTLMAASNVLQDILCTFYDTTSPEHFNAFIQALAERYRGLLSTLRSQSPCVIENTALLLHLLSTHAPATARAIREEALSTAIVLQHFHLAIFSPMEGQRFMSRYLCSIWFAGSDDCDEKRLLRRIVPQGFLTYLAMPLLSRMEEEQLDELERDCLEENIPEVAASDESVHAGASGTNTARLRSRITLATATSSETGIRNENFRIFFHVMTQDHLLPDLIWNPQTRRELRIALESELAYVRRETESRGLNGIAWNHQQFCVPYPSLDSEVKVGNVYMRLWLEAGDGFIKSWEEPLRLFEHLFRKFLCEIDRNEQVINMVILCLEKLYAVHAATIGPFPDVMILIRTMSSTRSIQTQHRLLRLLATVLGVGKDGVTLPVDIPENAEQLLNMESIGQLCQFIAWGHTDLSKVGNVLSRSLVFGGSKRAMITDGTTNAPYSNEAQSSLNDSVCPPVWFIASSGKIPPPSDLIRGPFRISDLVRMMDEGALNLYDLVTSALVEEYDYDESSHCVQEAHIDTGKWKRLNQVWQLRWMLCTEADGFSVLSPTEVALLAMRSLTRLVDLHRSLDSRGIPYLPIPIAKRIISGQFYTPGTESDVKLLPTICQALLCSDADAVDQAAELVYKVTRHNEVATEKLYRTGVFFFACCYTGSNFRALSKLLHATHFEQHFRSGYVATASGNELPPKDRSILGSMLPEGLLLTLVNYGYERFADVFVGNADTPEVIWTYDMRKHLIEMVNQHLGDFPLRLFQNNSTEYEYCPIPGIAYQRLENEIFCHNYYLRNLCDEVRFPDWPIAEPVEVFRACLDRFKKQLEQGSCSPEEGLERARQTLGLNEGDGSRELRQAYRRLARKFHPDKNPAGRESFEAIQLSYETLLPFIEKGNKIRVQVFDVDDSDVGTGGEFGLSGQRMISMLLLIQTQLLICRRYEKEMSRYKYPSYSVLLSCMNLPDPCVRAVESGINILSLPPVKHDVSDFIGAAAELVFRTCLVSPLNAEELVLESGVAILSRVLSFYVAAAQQMISLSFPGDKPQGIAPVGKLLSTIIYITRTLAGVAFYESGRAAIRSLVNLDTFLIVCRRCIEGYLHDNQATEENTKLKRFALEGLFHMAKDRELQQMMIRCGVLWPTLRAILSYDPTLETNDAYVIDDDDAGYSMASTNLAARQGAKLLGMLSGVLEEAPENKTLKAALEILLTEPIALMLRNSRVGEVLRVLNSNVETADIIWSPGMRKQLESFISSVERERRDSVQSADEELSRVGDFQYESLKKEVRIGGVYVRVFNHQGKEALSRIPDPVEFCCAILRFIAICMNASDISQNWIRINVEDDRSSSYSLLDIHSNSFLLAMKALLVMSRLDGIIDGAMEIEASIAPAVLLSVLELPIDLEAFHIGSEALTLLSCSQSFVDAVSKEGSLWRLIQVVERPDPDEKASDDTGATLPSFSSKSKALSWTVLEALSASSKIAEQMATSSLWLELLGVVVGYAPFSKAWSSRVGAAQTLSRLLWDPVTGPSLVEGLRRFLPPTLIVKLKEKAESMLEAFDSNSDTPELIWDSSMRSELRKVVGTVLDELIAKRHTGMPYNDIQNFLGDIFVEYAALRKELFVGGVYVSRFLKEPTFQMRDPNVFLEHLMHYWSKEIAKYLSSSDNQVDSNNTGIVTRAEEDNLSQVTTAIVYVCKVRGNLCDKLAEWGYMDRILVVTRGLIDQNLIGTPLLSGIRVLHVAVRSFSNIERLALIGQGEYREGVVNTIMKAINAQPLHKESAFLIEILRNIFEMALGDFKMTQGNPGRIVQSQESILMAPSPAPGEGPVRKKLGASDDPLAMFYNAVPSTVGQTDSFIPAHSHIGQYQTRSQPYNLNSVDSRGLNPSRHTNGQILPCVQLHYPLVSQPLPATNETFRSASQEFSLGMQASQRAMPGITQTYEVSGRYDSSQMGQGLPAVGSQSNQSHGQHYPNIGTYMQNSTQVPFAEGRGHGETNPVVQSAHDYPANLSHVQPQSYSVGAYANSFEASLQGTRTHHTSEHSSQSSEVMPSKAGHSVPWTNPTSQLVPQQGYPTSQDSRPSGGTSGMAYSSNTLSGFQNSHIAQQMNPQLIHTFNQNNGHPRSGPPMTNAHHAFVQGMSHEREGRQQNTQQAQYMLDRPPQPIVETVGEAVTSTAPVPQYRPSAVEGTGIDARSLKNPMVAAEERAFSSTGAPGALQGRVALLQQALACDLCEFLVDKVLENPDLPKVRDPAATKVHAIALLKALCSDPGYGPKFKLILGALPTWSKYKSQDHSLLISRQDRSENFYLTDGSIGDRKMLMDGGQSPNP